MKGLVIAEKPSVMRAIQDVYTSERGNFQDELEFAAFHGHLMSLKMPEMYEESWADRKNMAILPMIPSKFEYIVDDRHSVKQLVNKIQAGHYDYLVNACDAGREGELIFFSFYEGMNLHLPVKRLWTSSVTKPAIKKALSSLQPSSVYDGLREASKYRAQFDWLVGMNFSRAVSNKMYRNISIGRVQTPTLKLIVDKEKAIQEFKESDFFEVKAHLQVPSGEEAEFVYLIPPDHKQTHFEKEEEANAILSSVKQNPVGQIVNVKESISSTDAPTLYSLAELQKAANKYLKMKPDKTLKVAQELYEKGFLSYPRTESRFLPTDMVPELMDHIRSMYVVPTIATQAKAVGKPEIDRMLSKKYVNDAGVTDHHALIPTEKAPQWDKLSKDEQAIYELVAKSFLAIFMDPYKVSKCSLLAMCNGHLFLAKGKQELEKGFSILYPNDSKDVILPVCKKGDAVTVQKIAVKKGKTKPPQRYTPSSLIAAMQNAGNQLDDAAMRSILKESAGLGTSATRADILQKLEEREFIILEKNAYKATQKGISVIDTIGDRDFASAMLTAQWEERLKAVEDKTFKGNFRAEMESYIRSETKFLLEQLPSKEFKTIGSCPFCGGDVIEAEKTYRCRNHHNQDESSCRFKIFKTVYGYTLTPDDVAVLLNMDTTDEKEMVRKDGTPWKAAFRMDQEKGMIPVSTEPETSYGTCPKCGGNIVARGKAYLCEHSKKDDPDSCSFFIPRMVGGYSLTEEDLTMLFTKGSTDAKEITTKKGPASCVFRLKEDGSFDLEGTHKKPVGVCPVCKKPIFEGDSNYYCQGYRDKSCSFSISKTIKKSPISVDDLAQLLAGKKLDPRSFVWDNGKTGQAILSLVNGKLTWEFLQSNRSL